ncbi:hypothetical protein D1631_01485 [Chryseobacterium nematophagum]|uniref:Glycosyltransferase RgtA/B/C/D-like domain-containing protein n=1 Tax=Chryseobacterium nematophagum TaxID=2305228 RepID=A0A3M7TDH5_9FLAO|nr:hypothetical protein [Chryseobacterium nematophagum]RNA60699.1 hypothetical protein D1631_01485 [Chryseobacterium nematophagum]
MIKYKVLSILLVIIYFIQTLCVSFGGIGADSLSYFGIAADLPTPETNLFPLGYPILLRFFKGLLDDYFWASKILNCLFTVSILLFSYLKKFYFRETVLLFTGKTFFFVFFGAMSEGPFIFLLYFLFYFLHQIFSKDVRLYQNAVWASLILIGMFMMRYSGIYIYSSVILFCFLMYFKIRDKKYFKALIVFIILSGLGITGYLLFNFFHFGSFTGENLRGEPAEMLPIYILRDLLGVANAIDPFIGIKPASNSMGSIIFQCLILVIDICIFIYFLHFYKKAKKSPIYYFHILLWVIAGVYAFSLLVSGWYQQIEEMSVRLMAASNICLFFSFLILYFQNESSDKLILRIGCLFLVFLTLYNVKDPGNYLENKNKIQPQMAKFRHKKYLYNDEKNRVTTTIYYFPIIDKTLKYPHTNNQKGKLKESIAGTINPQIKWLKYDTVKDRSTVLYTSQLKF